MSPGRAEFRLYPDGAGRRQYLTRFAPRHRTSGAGGLTMSLAASAALD